jgi:hypothetical protein
LSVTGVLSAQGFWSGPKRLSRSLHKCYRHDDGKQSALTTGQSPPTTGRRVDVRMRRFPSSGRSAALGRWRCESASLAIIGSALARARLIPRTLSSLTALRVRTGKSGRFEMHAASRLVGSLPGQANGPVPHGRTHRSAWRRDRDRPLCHVRGGAWPTAARSSTR